MLMVLYVVDKNAPGNAAQGEMRLTDCHYISSSRQPTCMYDMYGGNLQTNGYIPGENSVTPATCHTYCNTYMEV